MSLSTWHLHIGLQNLHIDFMYGSCLQRMRLYLMSSKQHDLARMMEYPSSPSITVNNMLFVCTWKQHTILQGTVFVYNLQKLSTLRFFAECLEALRFFRNDPDGYLRNVEHHLPRRQVFFYLLFVIWSNVWTLYYLLIVVCVIISMDHLAWPSISLY
jgi:hypothetical protein